MSRPLPQSGRPGHVTLGPRPCRPGGRLDWPTLRDTIDLAALAAELLGPAPGRQGERPGRRHWWLCPFHPDRNPSLAVDPDQGRWKCFGCGASGSAADLVMGRKELSFGEAVRWLADWSGRGPSDRPAPRHRGPSSIRQRPSDRPSGLPEADAGALVAGAADRLWEPDGAAALDALRARGLADETIRAARLGWTPGVMVPRPGRPPFRADGIVIPWVESGRLTLAKIRQPEGRTPKYAEMFRNRPQLYVAAPVIQGRPAIVVEGELDALLVAQVLGGRAAVATLGSASGRIDAGILGVMLAASTWIIATDADEAGDRAASSWLELAPARCRRARPPAKDWTDVHAGGRNRIAYHLVPFLSGGPSREGLAGWPRWAATTEADEPPGILAGS